MNPAYREIISADLSATLHNATYQESYHATNEGAFTETMSKHVRPSIALCALLERDVVRILDLCFGLGYNTLCSLLEYQNQNFCGRLEIYSPEKDYHLLQKCQQLRYPEPLQPFLPILQTLCNHGIYQSKNLSIQLYKGDARDYLRNLVVQKLRFDVVYQDPFSPPKNPELWNLTHFQTLFALLHPSGILTTYSQSSRALYTAHCSGFYTYRCANAHGRDFSVCSPKTLHTTQTFMLTEIDWNHKLACNPSLCTF